MRQRSANVIGTALLAAAAAAATYRATPAPAAPGPQKEVLIAARDIPEGTDLAPSMLAAMMLPAEYAAKDAYRWVAASKAPDGKSHRWLEAEAACRYCGGRNTTPERLTARIPIPKGAQITDHALHERGRLAWSRRRIHEPLIQDPPGRPHPIWDIPDERVGAELPLETPFFDLIEPGDRVDVLASFEVELKGKSKGMPKSEKATATVLQDIQVLGKAAPAAGPRSLLLRLNPVEAQALMTARHHGVVSVLLRNPGDHEMRPLETAAFWSTWRRR